MIYVCPVHHLPALSAEVEAGYVVSLLGIEGMPPTPPGIAAEHHLRLAMDDIAEAIPGYDPPDRHHIDALLDFGALWQAQAPIVVHCFAGVSRSTAAALILMVQRNPGREREAATLLRARAAHAQPNRRLIQLADAALGCGGALREAVAAMGEADFSQQGIAVELPADL